MKTKLHQAAFLSSITLVAVGLLVYLGMKSRNEPGLLNLSSATNKATISLPVPATTDTTGESTALTYMRLGDREPVTNPKVAGRWSTFDPLPLQPLRLPSMSTPVLRSRIILTAQPAVVIRVSDVPLDYDIAVLSARSRDKWMLLDRQRD